MLSFTRGMATSKPVPAKSGKAICQWRSPSFFAEKDTAFTAQQNMSVEKSLIDASA